MTTLTAFEHQYIFKTQVHEKCFEWLISQDLKAIKVASHKGQICLKTQNHVGTIVTPFGTYIEILPKVFYDDTPDYIVKNRDWFISLLNQHYLHHGHVQQKNILSEQRSISKKAPHIHEWLLEKYLHLCKQLLSHGLESTYQSHNENANYIRGKINIADNIRQNQVRSRQQVVSQATDHRTRNSPVNRILLYALFTMHESNDSHTSAMLLKNFSHVCTFEVKHSSQLNQYLAHQYKKDLQASSQLRLTKLYTETLVMAEVILNNVQLGTANGKLSGFSLLFNMNSLFEKMVERALRETLNETERLLCQNSKYSVLKDMHNNQSYQLKPDFVIEQNHCPIRIVDAKWKKITPSTPINQADIYQMFVYGSHYFEGNATKSHNSLAEIWLVFPQYKTFDSPQIYTFIQNNVSLKVIPFDLKQQMLIINTK